MAQLLDHLKRAVDDGASDLFIVAGGPVSEKLDKRMIAISEEKVFPKETAQLMAELYAQAGRSMESFLNRGDDDFSFSLPGLARFRVNAYKQRGSLAAVVRIVAFDIPSYLELGIPNQVMDLADVQHGMILVTGTAGSGKSTTQACIIDRINHTRQAHIITLEDPIEYLHVHKKSIVNQREIGMDTDSYAASLRAALREDPDVILVGEMRDLETISTAVTAAETGHLVFSTLHTIGAAATIDRIIDVFPPHQQPQIRLQLATLLEAIISQQLMKTADGKGRVAAFEILHANSAIRALIREGKSHQIPSIIQTSRKSGMITMDDSIFDLYTAGRVSRDEAITFAQDKAALNKRLY